MTLRQLTPLSFLVLLAAAIASTGLLGRYPSSEFLWWVNQEIYCRLRGIFYLTEVLPLGPYQMAGLMLTLVGALMALGRHERVWFLANHLILLATIYAGLFDWKTGVATALPYAPNTSLLLVSKLDAPLALGALAAFASTISCHWRFLAVFLEGRSAPSTVPQDAS